MGSEDPIFQLCNLAFSYCLCEHYSTWALIVAEYTFSMKYLPAGETKSDVDPESADGVAAGAAPIGVVGSEPSTTASTQSA